MEHYINALQQYADFSSRTGRTGFWMFSLINFLIIIASLVVDSILGLGLVNLIYALAVFVPSIAISARRLHDTGRSGWWLLIAVVPLVGFIVLLVFLIQASHEENEYG